MQLHTIKTIHSSCSQFTTCNDARKRDRAPSEPKFMTDWTKRNEASSVSFRDAKVKSSLVNRGRPGAIAKRDLTRFYLLLNHALETVELTPEEAMLLCDALNGLRFDFNIDPSRSLFSEIQDAIETDDLANKWQVDGSGLLMKIKSCSTLQAVAIIDAIERFWSAPKQPLKGHDERLKCVRLIRGNSTSN
jgi:hypothetical protein